MSLPAKVTAAHIREARAIMRKLFDGDELPRIAEDLARELARLEQRGVKAWRDEVKRAVAFERGECCQVCGGAEDYCRCTRPR